MGGYHAFLESVIYRKYPHTAPLERVRVALLLAIDIALRWSARHCYQLGRNSVSRVSLQRSEMSIEPAFTTRFRSSGAVCYL